MTNEWYEVSTDSGDVLLLPTEFADRIRRRWLALTGSSNCSVQKKRLLVGGVGVGGDQKYLLS